MSAHHRARGDTDPYRAHYLSAHTERLPVYEPPSPRHRLARIQIVSHVIAILLMVVALISLVALDVAAYFIYRDFFDIVKYIFVLRNQ